MVRLHHRIAGSSLELHLPSYESKVLLVARVMTSGMVKTVEIG